MSEEKRIQKLLDALEERMIRGEISENNYEQLKNKFQNRLSTIQAGSTSHTGTSNATSEESILKQALEKIVTRVYACDYCGGVLDVIEGSSKAKCSFCGYTNEVDYLSRISERVRAERTDIIKGAMDSFAKVTNLEQVKIPIHERFLAAAHIYESRALRLEDEVGKSNEYSDGDFQDERERFIKIEDRRQFYEASKSWHQVAELYRNAAEFAPTSVENKRDLAASFYYDGLAFLDVSFAPIRLMNNTFYVKMSRGASDVWPWSEDGREKVCETVEDLLKAKNYFPNQFSRSDMSVLRNEIEKTAHPILIRPEAIYSSLHSALKATNCFLKSYETLKEEQYLVYALVSKLIAYTLYSESLRGHSYVGQHILRNIAKIYYEFYSPAEHRKNDPVHMRDERSLKHTNSLRAIAKQFALFAIAHFEDYVMGFGEDWKQKEIYCSVIECEVPRSFGETIDKVDQTFSQKTFPLTLLTKPLFGSERKVKNNVGFKFSWILGSYKTGFLSYDKPWVYLSVESSTNQKGTISTYEFFESHFNAFMWLGGSPSILVNYLGKSNLEETKVEVNIEGKKGWNVRLDSKQFLDLYSSLCMSFIRINHSSAQEVRKRYNNRLKYVESWTKKTKELLTTGIPKVLEGKDSQVLTPEFINQDLDFLSFFANQLPTFPILDLNQMEPNS